MGFPLCWPRQLPHQHVTGIAGRLSRSPHSPPAGEGFQRSREPHMPGARASRLLASPHLHPCRWDGAPALLACLWLSARSGGGAADAETTAECRRSATLVFSDYLAPADIVSRWREARTARLRWGEPAFLGDMMNTVEFLGARRGHTPRPRPAAFLGPQGQPEALDHTIPSAVPRQESRPDGGAAGGRNGHDHGRRRVGGAECGRRDRRRIPGVTLLTGAVPSIRRLLRRLASRVRKRVRWQARRS
jgi:hypothetical protein